MRKFRSFSLLSLCIALSAVQAFAAPEQGSYDYRALLGKWTVSHCDVQGDPSFQLPGSAEVGGISEVGAWWPGVTIAFDSQPRFSFDFVKINQSISPSWVSYTTQSGVYTRKLVKRTCHIGTPGMCIERDSETIGELRAESEDTARFTYELKTSGRTSFTLNCELQKADR